MRKTLVLILAMFIATEMTAQRRDAGEWSVIPKVGVNLSRLNNDKLWIGESGLDEYINSSYKPGYEAGVDLEYMVSDRIGVTVGAMYAMQSEKFKDYHTTEKVEGADNLLKFEKFENIRENFGFLNVPIKVSYYLTDNIALKAGVQLGFMLSAKSKGNTVAGVYDKKNPNNIIYYDANGNPAEEGSQVYLSWDDNTKATYHHFDMSIPVGISYEYENVILDAQYRIGLKDIAATYGSSIRTSVFSITVGYRLRL